MRFVICDECHKKVKCYSSHKCKHCYCTNCMVRYEFTLNWNIHFILRNIEKFKRYCGTVTDKELIKRLVAESL